MKPFIIIIVVLIVGLLGYLFMSNSQNENPSSTINEEETAAETDVDEESETGVESDIEFSSDLTITGEEGDMVVEAVENETHVFDIGGHNFGFDVTEIRVKEGDTVTINFTSTDGFHDWVVDEFDAKTAQVETGGSTLVTFVADKAGTYEYYCSVGRHRANGMVGTLIVE